LDCQTWPLLFLFEAISGAGHRLAAAHREATRFV